jgi:putative nucleotidyltransferase with HDIG domain
MNRQQMINKIDRISDLPTLPTVAMEINRLLQDVNAPIEKLVDMLEKDQSMVLKILRLVNSSFYGFRSKISNLRHAVTLMGYSTVQHAVVTVAVIDSLKTETTLKGFDITSFWTHSLSVGVMCRHLAAQTKLTVPNEAFTAGLIHDIGKVVLVSHFPEVFVDLMETVAKDEITFYAAEKAGDTYPHNLIGSNLARRWMLPQPLDLAIRHHHGDIAQNMDGTFAGLVAIADTLVNVMEGNPGHRLGANVIAAAIRDPVMKVLKDSAQWFPQVKQEMASACDFFIKR